ncbi:MAG: hypothetical protein H6752_20320 [Candidatus Omnitrophica bacterium]|nr:hypothetical protein [Candidatus Omnitrophota bacterium]
MKICLAASGGGHLRQLARLKPFYEKHEAFLITQETPLGSALSEEIRTYFIPDIALGKMKRSPREWGTYLDNLSQSYKTLKDEKPDLILSTGAGLAFNTLWMGKYFKAKTLFIESIAHVYTPTATGKTVSKWATAYVVQWEELHNQYPDSVLACPIRTMGEKVSPSAEGGTFVTVGTHGPFPRLIDEVERLSKENKLPRPVVVQHPGNTPILHADLVVENCSSEDFEKHLKEASLVITHAGTGSIFSALEAERRVIAIARLAEHGEHYDDHQREILIKLSEMGAILGSDHVEDLESLIEASHSFEPITLQYDSNVIIEAIEGLTAGWFPKKG